MKPADHPEFFRLPPPEGRSRESTIVLGADGRFFHDGHEVTHPGMARAFATWIGKHPDDGRFILNNGYDWTYFTVEGTPFFRRRFRAERPGQSPEIVLSDWQRRALRPEPPAREPGRGAVRGRQGWSVPGALYALGAACPGELLVEDAGGALFFDFDGRRVPIPDPHQKA
jgi:hypothetical protein